MNKNVSIIISFLLFFSNANSQIKRPDREVFVELRSGLQVNDNFKYGEHLIGGYYSLSYDNKKHYAVYDKDSRPIELVIGFEYRKKFRSQLHLNYYKQEMTLEHPLYSYHANNEQPYPLNASDMLIIKASALFDLLSEKYEDPLIHAWAGLSTGINVPIGYSLNAATKDHFGINKFEHNAEWFLGYDLLLTIRLTKCGLYLLSTMSMLFPFYGDIGKLEMQTNSEYESINPIKVFTANWLIGIGYRFGTK